MEGSFNIEFEPDAAQKQAALKPEGSNVICLEGMPEYGVKTSISSLSHSD